MPRISVIVPVYNVEGYLEKSVKSIQEQTIRDIQIILVNDGSTDRSLSVCQSLAKNDTRIVVIDQPNGGVSSARNAGLEFADGDCVGFVDPDDWIERDMYQSMYDTICQTNSDICMCNYVIENPRNSTPIVLPFEESVFGKEQIIEQIVSEMLASPTLDSRDSPIMGSVCRILLKRELIEKTGIRFEYGVSYMEDLIFCIQALLKSDLVSIDQGKHYHYVTRNGSASNKYYAQMREMQQTVFALVEETLEKESVYDLLEDRMDLRYVDLVFSLIKNEMHPHNTKSVRQRINTISTLCEDKRLKRTLDNVDTRGYTLRRRLLIASVKRGWSISIFAYHTLVNMWLSIQGR